MSAPGNYFFQKRSLRMSRLPDYTHNVSLRISQVMDEIGVNERIVIKMRRFRLLDESVHTLTQDLNVYLFGSKTEGTSTLGLQSDTDYLISLDKSNVIQDWSEWEHGKFNLLMIQDETVPPGYCLLQELKDNAPLPADVDLSEHSSRDCRGRILLKNTCMNIGLADERVRHGPAHSSNGKLGFPASDIVPAFPCQTYPVQATKWLDQHREVNWPYDNIRQYCINTGCFTVGVGGKDSINEELEWRISTSLAERCLMFNLNITQIRCYVLMKMILKTFITPQYPEMISSFMCKNVLFHCISNTRAVRWKENSLLICLSFCLTTLYNCVLNEYCPHFILTENNLMMRRFPKETKPFILDALYYIIQSNGTALLEIECDNIGMLLQFRFNDSIAKNAHISCTRIAGGMLMNTALAINDCCYFFLRHLKDLSPRQAITILLSITSKLLNTHLSYIGRYACSLIVQHLCHTIGTILASSKIIQRDILTHKALSFISLGLNADVTSGKLKLASIFYCKGDIKRTELILKTIEKSYDLSVIEPICKCSDYKKMSSRERFNIFCYESNEDYMLIKHVTAYCVNFLKCEVNCCPYELRHEMFRSTQEDLPYRHRWDHWMDMAVVDSLPYLYFLQYKTYSRLGRSEEKNKALSNLIKAIEEEPNFGHRETALNLLGQCMVTENRTESALKCYLLSLKLRNRNNSAKFLICRLLSTVVNGPER